MWRALVLIVLAAWALPSAAGASEDALRRDLARLEPQVLARVEARIARLGLPATEAGALRVDAAGELFYACAAPPYEAAPARARAVGATVALGAAPALHSRPGCPRIIHLDFDGQVVTGTAWNANAGVARWDALPYDLDGDPARFSADELAAMRRIWERVSEDFAPFAVDVTTEDAPTGPSVARVLVTRDRDGGGRDCPGMGAGGIAYIGVWGYARAAYYAPAWVYFNRLAGGREDYVAEACSHEAGHLLGLHHDGTADTTYYGGHGSGETRWAPIMGVAYGANISQWCCGGYPGANQTEDDLAIIGSHLGWNADQPDATLSLTTAGAFATDGVIGERGDRDDYTLVAGAGPLALTVAPYRATGGSHGGNLDARIELRDAAGGLVAVAAPDAMTGATLTCTVAAGRYLVTVVGDGAPDVYSADASLGAYQLSGEAVPPEEDTVAPGAVAGLTAVADATGLQLTWTAPGDDGDQGTAALYDLRSAPTPIADEADWAAAERAGCATLPELAGTAQCHHLSGLPANGRRWIALRAFDEVGNPGPVMVADAVAPPPELAIADAVVTADAGGGLLATFTVTCTPASAIPLSVDWATADGSARAPADYSAASGVLVFAPGQTSRTLVIAAMGGRAGTAWMEVDLASASAAVIADGEAIAELPPDLGITGVRGVTVAPLSAATGGGGSGGCGAGSALALLVLVGTASLIGQGVRGGSGAHNRPPAS